MRTTRLPRLPITGFSFLFCTVACAAACSSGPSAPPTSSSSPSGSDSAGSSGSSATSSAAPSSRSISLTGDGHALHLNGAPADPSYVATYPVSGLTAMTITASSFGDLAATCASGAGALSCKSLPFFAAVKGGGAGGANVTVYDAYGHAILAVPAATPLDAGAATPPPAPTPATPPDAGSSNGAGSGAGAGSGSGGGSSASSCVPSVNASLSGCSLTVGGVTCDCSDASCTSGAIQSCVGNLTSGLGTGVGASSGGGLPGLGFLDDAGLGGLLSDDGGIPGLGLLDDAGIFGAGCSAASIASAKAQFCADVDAWLAAHGMSATTLDCSAIGTLSFPTSLPAASTSGFTCDQITHDAFVKVRTDLATCDPLDYVGWDSSAELQLFEDSACTVW